MDVDQNTPDVDDNEESNPRDLVTRIVNLTGAPSDEMKLNLLRHARRNLGNKRKMEEMAAELKSTKALLADSATSAAAQTKQFNDTVIPFMLAMNANFTKNDAEDFRKETTNGRPNAFISRFGPQLVAASRSAMAVLNQGKLTQQETGQQVTSLVQQRLAALQQAYAMESSSRAGQVSVGYAAAPPPLAAIPAGPQYSYVNASNVAPAAPIAAAAPSFVMGQLPNELQGMFNDSTDNRFNATKLGKQRL